MRLNGFYHKPEIESIGFSAREQDAFSFFEPIPIPGCLIDQKHEKRIRNGVERYYEC